MSLVSYCILWLPLNPNIFQDDIHFSAQTPLFIQLLSLFSYRRSLSINREKRLLILRVKRLWVWNHIVEIHFDRIERIENFLHFWTAKRDIFIGPLEWLVISTVCLILDRDTKPVKLFTCINGIVQANCSSISLWSQKLKRTFDCKYKQEFVGTLQSFLNKPVV